MIIPLCFFVCFIVLDVLCLFGLVRFFTLRRMFFFFFAIVL